MPEMSELDFTATALRKLAPEAPAGYYYAGAAAFMRGDVEGAVSSSRRLRSIRSTAV